VCASLCLEASEKSVIIPFEVFNERIRHPRFTLGHA
jgi:hypothetical protein